MSERNNNLIWVDEDEFDWDTEDGVIHFEIVSRYVFENAVFIAGTCMGAGDDTCFLGFVKDEGDELQGQLWCLRPDEISVVGTLISQVMFQIRDRIWESDKLGIL